MRAYALYFAIAAPLMAGLIWAFGTVPGCMVAAPINVWLAYRVLY